MLARIMDNQVWFEAYLRDTSWKGGIVRVAHRLHPREASCGSKRWFKQSTLWISGRWAGPATPEMQ